MKKIVPITLLLLTSLISYAYQVQLNGLVAGPGGNGIPETQVLIYSSPDLAFSYEKTVVTDQDGLFAVTIDIPDDIQQGAFLVKLVECPNSQIKRINFNPNHREHKVKLQACRDDHKSDCRVEIRAQRRDDGQITLKAIAKGKETISYAWSTGESTASIIVSELREYCVEITDAEGCSDRDCIDLAAEDCKVEIAVSQADANSGSLVLAARTKGHGPFSYLWSNGDTTKVIRVEEGGEYCVSIVDALGCEARDCRDIQFRDHCKTEIQVISSDVINDGPVVLVAQTLGTAPFEYLWSNGETTERITVEAGGKYCVRVTDSLGCHSGDCIDLDRKDCDVKIQAKRSHPHSDSSYFLLTARAKGRGDITYEWSNGETTPQIKVSEQTEYCVTITDAAGCESRACINLSLRDECATQIQVAPATNDLAGGVALVARTKGRAPFSFLWSTGETTQTILPNDTGEYCVEVIDAAGCRSTDCIDLSNLRDSCAVEIRGNLRGVLVAVTKGGPFVRYLWSTGQTSKHIKVEEPGEYCVTITNAFGCEATACYSFDGISDTVCRVKIFRKPTDGKKIVLTAETLGVGDFEFIWSTGETTQSIIVDTSGEYCVTAFNNNCKIEDCMMVNFGNGINAPGMLGLSSEKKGMLKSKVTPNPFHGRIDLSLKAETEAMATIQIFSLEGQMVFQTQQRFDVGANTMALELGHLHAGMYFVKIKQGQNFETMRIIKSN